MLLPLPFERFHPPFQFRDDIAHTVEVIVDGEHAVIAVRRRTLYLVTPAASSK